jgi:hypothetical protein
MFPHVLRKRMSNNINGGEILEKKVIQIGGERAKETENRR